MAKYSNVFVEASRRFRDFKARGFIPEGAKYAYQDFVQEVTAENRGEEYKGAYTAKAYELAYGETVEYYENTTYDDLNEDRLDRIFDQYQQELIDIYDTNDFWDLAERYGAQFDFDPGLVHTIDNLDELVSHARQAQKVQPFLFRNKTGRNRRQESGQMETYFNNFLVELNRLIAEINEQRMMFMY